MAVKFKTGLNGLAAIQKIGIKQANYDWLSVSEVSIKLTPDRFIFFLPTPDPEAPVQTWEVPVALNQLHALAANTLSVSQKASLGAAIDKVIDEIKNSKANLVPFKDAAPAETHEAVLKAPYVPEAKLLKTAKPGEQAKADWSEFDLTQLKTAPTVKLRNADRLYQPVDGSSPGSRYYLVAGNADLRVAARYSSASLSVRIEGPKFSTYAGAIAKCGLTVKGSKNYASIHLSVSDDLLAAKTLGAILLGLGVKFDSAFPDILKIKEA
jgi:hypothetical protein